MKKIEQALFLAHGFFSLAFSSSPEGLLLSLRSAQLGLAPPVGPAGRWPSPLLPARAEAQVASLPPASLRTAQLPRVGQTVALAQVCAVRASLPSR